MSTTIIGAIAAFISTNIDDLLLLILLYSTAKTPADRRRVTAGQFLGIAILTALSLGAALGLGRIPGQYLRLLGLVPILLALRLLLQGQEALKGTDSIGLLSVTLITLSNGGDNLGVYIPLFAAAPLPALGVCAAIFALFTLLWCALGMRLAGLPRWGEVLARYQRRLVPVVFLLLGAAILLGI